MTIRSWTPEQIEILRGLVESGVSLPRTAVALKRTQASVRQKAREIGAPFPSVRELRNRRLAQEAKARAASGAAPIVVSDETASVTGGTVSPYHEPLAQ
jgi:hypothetical protein